MPDLVRALERLGPREARWLLRAGLDGATVQALAEEYGVSQAAAGVHLFRAARDLAGALGGQRPPPLPDREEAPAVAAFLAGQGPAAEALRRVAAEQEAVRAGRAAAREAEARSGRRRVEEVLRWVAILAILGVALWSLGR